MQTSEVLNRAADLIKEKGLWKGSWQNTGGGTCVANAITTTLLKAGETEVDYTPAHKVFVAYIDGDTVGDIFRWNDDPSRTATDVVATLRAAAAIEEARESARGPIGDAPPVRFPAPREPVA